MLIRIVVCGDEGVGKSSLLAQLAQHQFVPDIEAVVPEFVVPGTPPAVLVDTHVGDWAALQQEVRHADAVWLVYSDHYTYERVALFWLTQFRDLGVNLPIVVCGNKSDQFDSTTDEFGPLLQQYKEIEACIRTLALTGANVVEALYLCRRAVTDPIAPLFDSREGRLKPDVVAALQRIFFLADVDLDGYLNRAEMEALQSQCFGGSVDLDGVHAQLEDAVPGFDRERGLLEQAFVVLNRIYAQQGRHETVWGILRAFHYTTLLLLDERFLHPHIDVPEMSLVELLPQGYRFLVDLFVQFDKDNDGGLNTLELGSLFQPTPGIPRLWSDANFPHCSVTDNLGHITLQGWLAVWLMTTLVEYKTTLEYLAWLGYDRPGRALVLALKVTRPRRRRTRNGHTFRTHTADRLVFLCFLVGPGGAGKSLLLALFLQRRYLELHAPTLHPTRAVNSVELPGGRQCHVILEELGAMEGPVLANADRLAACDVICYTYDLLDPELFQSLVEVRRDYPKLDELPLVFVGLKADLDRQQQRLDLQPDGYTRELHLPPPLHVLLEWPGSVAELMVRVAEAAQHPERETAGLEPEEERGVAEVALAAAVVAGVAGVALWGLRRR